MHRGPRVSVTQVIIGMFSLLLLFLSASTLLVTYRANAMADQAGIQRPMRTGSPGLGSPTSPTPTDTSTPSPSPTDTPTTTPSPTDTPTDTPTPSPTPTNTPSPTPTNTPTPKPTHTPTPSPTSSPSSSPTATATFSPHPSATPGVHGTPGAKASSTPVSGQGGGQGSTPTDSSTVTSNFGSNDGQDSSPGAQDSSLPLFDIIGGVLCTIGFLFLLFIGWRQLRKYLLPAPPVKLPPSGASPWSRERPDISWQQVPDPFASEHPDMPWQQTANPWQQQQQGFTPPIAAVASGYVSQTSVITPAQGTGNGLFSYQTQFPQPGYAGPPPSYAMNAPHVISAVPAAGGFAPSNGNVPPITDGFPVLPYASGPAVTNGQWTGGPTNAPPEVNDPYLLEMIRQSREKGNTSGQPMG